jgi:ACS family hexuronate transporter-like MFS transporter
MHAPSASATDSRVSAPDRLRWTILALLFSITVINFIDRQTLSILAPKLKESFHFNSTEYGRIVACFQFGMMVAEFPMGMLMDRLGSRFGFSFAVLWWSIATGLHAFGRSVWTFGLLRFWMGTGECANYSGAMKVVTRWFPEKERTLAVGVFNGGSMIGSILAPPLIVALNQWFGWQMAFLVPSVFGVIWVICWRRVYHMSASQERSLPGSAATQAVSALALLQYRQTWALMLCRFLAGPVMQFFWYWMPDYLYNVRGMSLVAIGAFSWLPYLLGDAGSIGGGWAAGKLLSKGHAPARTRGITMTIGAICCLASLAVVAASNVRWAIAIIGVVLFGHTFYSANMFASISDLFPPAAVGRVTGLTGLSGGLGGILFPLATGYLVDHYSYAPAFAIAAVLPLAGMCALFWLAPGLVPVRFSHAGSGANRP